MTTTTTETESKSMPVLPLSSDDIKALKAATTVSFVFHNMVSDWERQHYIRAVKTITEDGFERDLEKTVAVDGNIHDYQGGWMYPEEERKQYHGGYTAYASIQSAQFATHWRTILGHLRAGDKLILRWLAANDTETLVRAGLHHDELWLRVERTTAAGNKQTFEYFLDDRITPDNSTARMVRRG